MPKKQHPVATNNARELRARQTEAEAILWSVLRARRLAGLKFRRQHPIEPWIADFACVNEKLIVELEVITTRRGNTTASVRPGWKREGGAFCGLPTRMS